MDRRYEELTEHRIKEQREVPELLRGEIFGQAVTIGAYNIPDSPEYIGSKKTKHDTYHYFRDADGKYYFESERIMEFDRQIRESQKRRHEKKYSKKAASGN